MNTLHLHSASQRHLCSRADRARARRGPTAAMAVVTKAHVRVRVERTRGGAGVWVAKAWHAVGPTPRRCPQRFAAVQTRPTVIHHDGDTLSEICHDVTHCHSKVDSIWTIQSYLPCVPRQQCDVARRARLPRARHRHLPLSFFKPAHRPHIRGNGRAMKLPISGPMTPLLDRREWHGCVGAALAKT